MIVKVFIFLFYFFVCGGFSADCERVGEPLFYEPRRDGGDEGFLESRYRGRDLTTSDVKKSSMYSSVCRLYVFFEGRKKPYYGSGIIVTPTIILTAAHCLYGTTGSKINKILCLVGPSLEDGSYDKPASLQEISVTPTGDCIYIHRGYDQAIQNMESNLPICHDIAFINLNSAELSCENKTKEEILEMLRVNTKFNDNENLSRVSLNALLKKQEVTITGCIERDRFSSTHEGKVMDVKKRLICYSVDTESGQSGSGICVVEEGGGFCCLGVHTSGAWSLRIINELDVGSCEGECGCRKKNYNAKEDSCECGSPARELFENRTNCNCGVTIKELIDRQKRDCNCGVLVDQLIFDEISRRLLGNNGPAEEVEIFE